MGQKCGCQAATNGGFEDDETEAGFFDLPPGFKEPPPSTTENADGVKDDPTDPDVVVPDNTDSRAEETVPLAGAAAVGVGALAGGAALAASQQDSDGREEQERAEEAERQRQEQLQFEREAEARRQAEEQRQREEEDRRRQEEAERQAEEQRQAEAAAAAAAAAPAGGEFDPAAVAQLTELGFTEQQAQDALRRHNGNTEMALSSLLDEQGGGGGGGASSAPAPSGGGGGGGGDDMDDKVQQLVAMGFPEQASRRKLMDANGDVNVAMSMLLSDG